MPLFLCLSSPSAGQPLGWTLLHMNEFSSAQHSYTYPWTSESSRPGIRAVTGQH